MTSANSVASETRQTIPLPTSADNPVCPKCGNKKMNKQMTPAEIEVLQQSFARFASLSEKATLVGIESGPLPPPSIPAALALAGMTMK